MVTLQDQLFPCLLTASTYTWRINSVCDGSPSALTTYECGVRECSQRVSVCTHQLVSVRYRGRGATGLVIVLARSRIVLLAHVATSVGVCVCVFSLVFVNGTRHSLCLSTRHSVCVSVSVSVLVVRVFVGWWCQCAVAALLCSAVVTHILYQVRRYL